MAGLEARVRAALAQPLQRHSRSGLGSSSTGALPRGSLKQQASPSRRPSVSPGGAHDTGNENATPNLAFGSSSALAEVSTCHRLVSLASTAACKALQQVAMIRQPQQLIHLGLHLICCLHTS